MQRLYPRSSPGVLRRVEQRTATPSLAPLADMPLDARVDMGKCLMGHYRTLVFIPMINEVTPPDGKRTSSQEDLHSLSPHSPAAEKEDGSQSGAATPVTGSGSTVVTVQFPEGGLRGWLTVLGGTMVTFCTFGIVQSYGVFQDYYTRHSLKEHTPSSISWIGSVQVFFVFAMGLPAGRLFDAGYFHHCLLGGSIIYIVSVFMLSLVQPHHYYQTFLAQGVGMGIGMGAVFLPSLTITSHYFRKRRSLAMGCVIAGSSLGGCLYPILLNSMFPSSSGFGSGVRAVAYMDIGLLIIANLIMKTRLPPKPRSLEKSSVLRQVLTDVPYLVFALGAFLVFWGVFVPFFYLQLFAVHHDLSPTLVKYSITIMNATSILGRTIPNLLADFLGPMNVLIPSGVISAGLVFALFGATNAKGVVLFGIFYGFFSGGVISMITPAASCFSTQVDQSDIGIRIGLLSFILAFALLTGNPIAGALLSPPLYEWHRPLIFAAVITLSGAICHLIARHALAKRRGTKKT